VEGIKATALKWNVSVPDTIAFSTTRERVGNRCVRSSTKEAYYFHYLQLWRFCAIIGDYDSMLILLNGPSKVPAMKLETIEAFVRFKRKTQGTPLVSIDGIPILDVFGAQVLCDGNWKAPNKVTQCVSAISALHTYRDHTDRYIDVCADCQAAVAHQPLGCELHNPQGAHLYRQGNPTTHATLKHTMHHLQQAGADYQPKGASQLLPCDLRQIWRYLLSSQCIVKLQTWVMILMSCKMFL